MRADVKAEFAAYLRTWETWETLAPQAQDADEPTGRASEKEVNGSIRREQPWRITATPEEIITSDPNASALFPGAIVQAAPAIQQGRLISAGIEDTQRTPLRIDVNVLAPGESITVNRPSRDRVMNAVKSAVEGMRTDYSAVLCRTVGYHTGAQTALGLGLSPSYLGSGTAPQASVQRPDGRNAVAVYLRERVYTVACDMPPSADQLINDDFTGRHLVELVDSGAMGPRNPPVLVSHVIYGRFLAFVISSTTSEEHLDQAVKAGYSAFADVDSQLRHQHQKVLGDAEISLLSPNGNPAIVGEQLKNGTLANSFRSRHHMTNYGPIGFMLRTLDGHPATKSETADYQKITWS
ncbi:thiol-activated cytolysin family protein [Streptomyces sp. L2]|uniref:thiol-activated cytolysin family protein n=1 Tax=Streptomyces sp. L2 TaxID=2162665 RepID=UPI0013E9896A|nr:thiol-activated cytolysin family protein [Streptomyces sp. L2]